LELTKPLTEMSTRNISCEVTTLPPFHVPTDMKSWSFTFLEHSGPVQPFPNLKRYFFLFTFNILCCATVSGGLS